MNQNVVGALREDEALRALRTKLDVPAAQNQCNGYLLRYLRAASLNVDDAARRLEARRQFEDSIATIFCTAHTVSSLQTGAFAMIGEDVFRRPILHIRIKDYKHSGDSTSETRVAVVVLEYLATLVESRGVEQCIVLLDEKDAGFWAGGDANLHEKIAALVQKHYPGLIGAVLVVNSSWGTKRILRLHAAAGTSNPQLRQLVQFVSSKELTSLISINTIPIEFGGSNNINQTCPPDEFCDRVLRHWYALSGVLQAEAASAKGHHSIAPTRPAWMPVARAGLLSNATAGIVAKRIIAATNIARARQAGDTSALQTARGAPTPRVYGGTADDMTDDGRCSMISDSDLVGIDDDFAECESAGGMSFKSARSALSALTASAFTAAPAPTLPRKEHPDETDDALADNDADALRERLRLEVQRRKALEVAVDQLKLGTTTSTAEGREAKAVEATLRKHHEHVNALVAQIASQNRQTRPERTLAQLIDLTDQALLGSITKEQQATPCMSGAAPVNRKPASGCTVM